MSGDEPTHPQASSRPDTTAASFGALFSAVMLPMFMAAVDQTLLSTATPRIATELGGLRDASWLMVGYLLATTITAPLYGRMGDRFGRRQVMLVALAVFVAGSIACALAPSMPLLIAARILQGLGGGGLMVLSHSLIGELVPAWERPRYQGYFALVFTTSSVSGPLLGGFVVNHGDWRWLFLANLPLGALAAWRVSRLPRQPHTSHRHAPLDVTGFALFVVCACAALLWFSQTGHRYALLSTPSATLAGVFVVSGAVLWRQQRRHSHPFLPVDVLRIPGMPWICLSVIGFTGTLFALLFLLPIYVQSAHGADAMQAGLQLMPLTLGVVLGSTLNGRVSLHTGRSGMLPPWGLATAALALLSMALLPPTPWTIGLAMGVCGMSFGTVMPNAQVSSQLMAGPHRLGASSALLSLTRATGSSVGTAAFGGLAFVLLQPADPAAGLRLDGIAPERVAQSFDMVFMALAAFAAVGAWAASRAPVVDLRAHEQGRGAAPDPSFSD